MKNLSLHSFYTLAFSNNLRPYKTNLQHQRPLPAPPLKAQIEPGQCYKLKYRDLLPWQSQQQPNKNRVFGRANLIGKRKDRIKAMMVLQTRKL